jgi:hypothetical protein
MLLLAGTAFGMAACVAKNQSENLAPKPASDILTEDVFSVRSLHVGETIDIGAACRLRLVSVCAKEMRCEIELACGEAPKRTLVYRAGDVIDPGTGEFGRAGLRVRQVSEDGIMILLSDTHDGAD